MLQVKSVLLYLLASLMPTLVAAQDEVFYNWIAPPPQVQLDLEGLDDVKGLGRLFLPAMTSPDFEPVYSVIYDDSVIRVQKMGKSVWLRPGHYTITFGSGTLAQSMKKEIDIKAEETRILKPDWSGLTIRIIDEAREWLKEPYEIYRLPEGEPFGIGYGADEQLGENLRTWILPPGLYKIVKLGENVNSYINFATVRLLPGELIQFTIVMDSQTRAFRGAGVLDFSGPRKKLSNWSVFSPLYGSFTLNRANDVTNKEQQTSMAFVAQLDYNLKYSTPRHYFLSRGQAEEGWNIQRGLSNFQSFLDNLRLKNIYIFYFLPGLGIYGRFFLETNIFTTNFYFDSPTQVKIYNEDGQLKQERKNIKKIVLSPKFSPLELKEGLGINLMVLKSLWGNLNLRAGMGYRQNINWHLLTKRENEAIFDEKSSTFLQGPEAAVIGNVRLFQNVMITSELDLLVSSEKSKALVFDWENNFNLRLTKNISIDYTLRLKRDQSIVSYTQYEHILLLRYSYILF